MQPSDLGFNAKPANWNVWWVVMWFVASPTLVVLAFHIDFWPWVGAAVVGFLIPELTSILRRRDSLPPLTHTIRHFLPNWLAFPLIYFSLGSVGAQWLDFSSPMRIGLLMGLLGWLTDHFTVTYAGEDPFPYSGRQRTPETDEQPAPA